MDSMMEVLESYAFHLEEKVAERSGELDAANKALEGLLHEVKYCSKWSLLTSNVSCQGHFKIRSF